MKACDVLVSYADCHCPSDRTARCQAGYQEHDIPGVKEHDVKIAGSRISNMHRLTSLILREQEIDLSLRHRRYFPSDINPF